MTFMESNVARVLRRLKIEDSADRGVLDRPREERLFTLHPDSAELVRIMVQAAECKNIVEIGVAHGYSTICLAEAARSTGGKIKSLEINPKAIEFARQNLAEAGLSDMVEFLEGDARELLRAIQGPVEFVLMDCWEDVYIDCLKLIVPLLRPGGLLVADNVVPGNPESDGYVRALHENPEMDSVSVPIGRNIEVSVKRLWQASE
jgi:predicted O-methyltransferase YrrM